MTKYKDFINDLVKDYINNKLSDSDIQDIIEGYCISNNQAQEFYYEEYYRDFYEKVKELQEKKIKELAIDMVQHYHDLNPFEFTFREELEGVLNLYFDLKNGYIDTYIDTIKEDLENEEDEIERENFQNLLERLNDLKEA